MPVIIVYGLNPMHQDIKNLATRLRDEVPKITELRLTSNQVTVFVPHAYRASASHDVIAIVEGLFITPERTFAVRHKLAILIGEVIVDWCVNQPELDQDDDEEINKANTVLIEVFVKGFDTQASGFVRREVSPGGHTNDSTT